VAPRYGARIEVTVTPALSASFSFALRRGKGSRLGLFLALLALLAQIAGPGLHPPALVSSTNGGGELAIAFGAHALCLASDSAESGPATPVDKPPPKHHDFAACCFWHGSTGAVLAPAILAEAIAFAPIRVVFTTPPADIPTRKSGTARARAPPSGT
jgi:hypothetical protein